jgi:hypothetical protein
LPFAAPGDNTCFAVYGIFGALARDAYNNASTLPAFVEIMEASTMLSSEKSTSVGLSVW